MRLTAPLTSASHPAGRWSPSSANKGAPAAYPNLSIPLLLDSPAASTSLQPVTTGIPFPRGALADPQSLRLFDDAGSPVPLQALPLARWPDGTVKWLLLDFPTDSLAAGCSPWLLRQAGPAAEAPPASPLRVSGSGRSVVVDTGGGEFHLGGRASGLLSLLEVAAATRAGRPSLRLLLTDRKGRTNEAKVRHVSWEAGGPVRAGVRLEGRFPGGAPLRFVAHLDFFAGTGLVRLRLTVHNPRPARHPGGLWDLGDPGSVLFRDLSLELRWPGPENPCLTWSSEAGRPARTCGAADFELYQDSSGGDHWQSRNHVNRELDQPCSFRGYRVRAGSRKEWDLRASPVVSLHGPGGRVTVALPEFWQQFPKAIEAKGGSLRFRLFPAQWADLFELQGGEQKTHTVWLQFDGGGPPGDLPLDWVHRPARARTTAAWHQLCETTPYVPPDGSAPELDGLLSGVVAGPGSFFARREVIDEYGWRNYGDVYADHEGLCYAGPAPIISHYNNQYDVVYGALLQYFRTGDGRWYDLLDPLARHVIDIDIYHTDRDRAAYSGGLFWHTDHNRDAATATHRCYSRHNAGLVKGPYGGGPCNEHNYTTGLLHYYYLTGDPSARDAVLSLADWVVRMDDGRNNLLGLVDDGPTGLASATTEPGYHGPGRGCGNSVNALLDAWLLTRDRGYLDRAEGLIRRVIHPRDDVSARNLLDAARRWSYTVFLSALNRYLLLKAEAGELDFMYAYAQASLLTYARWMADNELPYRDHLEQSDPFTETWAAQELRKANVLRLAAAHADEPLRSRLLSCGHELAALAWDDLQRFPTRAVARAVALCLIEGTRDAYLRAHAVPPAPRPAEAYDFGLPQPFVPQRQRVLAQLKTPRGLLRALVKAADVRRWWRVFGPRARLRSPAT